MTEAAKTARRAGNDLSVGEAASCPSLEGKSVLVAEDNVILSMHLCMVLEEAGARVIGPFPFAYEAMESLSGETPDAAVLDFDLGDTTSSGVADSLTERGVPFAFFTGARAVDLGHWTDDAPVIAKPNSDAVLLGTMRTLLG